MNCAKCKETEALLSSVLDVAEKERAELTALRQAAAELRKALRMAVGDGHEWRGLDGRASVQ